MFSKITLHLISSVSSRLISTSSPPTSLMASWHVSCKRLKSRMAHRAIMVAVWFPLCDEKNCAHFRKLMYTLVAVLSYSSYCRQLWLDFRCSLKSDLPSGGSTGSYCEQQLVTEPIENTGGSKRYVMEKWEISNELTTPNTKTRNTYVKKKLPAKHVICLTL